jgi:hypothetical protein
MGVVIEICIKYPGGPTRITVTDVLPGCFVLYSTRIIRLRQAAFNADIMGSGSRQRQCPTAATVKIQKDTRGGPLVTDHAVGFPACTVQYKIIEHRALALLSIVLYTQGPALP